MWVGKRLITGDPRFDSFVGGFRRGRVTQVSVVPAAANVKLLAMIVCRISKAGESVLVLSPARSKSDLMDHLIAEESGVAIGRLKSGLFSRKQWPAITRAAKALSKAPIYVNDSAPAGVNDFQRMANEFAFARKEKRPSLLIIDTLEAIRGGGRGKTMDGLKKMVRELDVPVLTLSRRTPKRISQTGADCTVILAAPRRGEGWC